jgi:hypothetical protein
MRQRKLNVSETCRVLNDIPFNDVADGRSRAIGTALVTYMILSGPLSASL